MGERRGVSPPCPLTRRAYAAPLAFILRRLSYASVSFLFVTVSFFAQFVQAGDPPAERHAKAIAPFVDTQTCVVVHLDVSKLDVDMLAKHLKFLDEAAPDKGKELEKVKALATLAKATFLSCGRQRYLCAPELGRSPR